jgi:L-threonylcarbamoyladenylate synthase
MESITANVVTADQVGIARAGEILRAGGLVAFPTETVYGLGADATKDRAVAAIFAAKDRPRFNPLIVHVRDLPQAETHAEFNLAARALAERFWPGPLSLVLPRKQTSPLSLLVSAGLETVALRVPSNSIAQKMLAAAGRPIAAPSANLSGQVSATTAAHVAADFGERVDLVLDGGATRLGLESTVIGFDGERPVLLRPGAVPREEIERVAGPLTESASGRISSPGQLASHYAPRTPLRLNAKEVGWDEALLAFGPPLAGGKIVRNLSASGDLMEAAANFFAGLRELDAAGTRMIAAMPVPEHGLGEAINDRLRRAAERP